MKKCLEHGTVRELTLGLPIQITHTNTISGIKNIMAEDLPVTFAILENRVLQLVVLVGSPRSHSFNVHTLLKLFSR